MVSLIGLICLAVLGIFGLGVVGAFWLMFKFVSWLSGPAEATPQRQSTPLITPDLELNPDALSRIQKLEVVQKEVRRAFNFNFIRKETFTDVGNYLENELRLADPGRAKASTQPQKEPDLIPGAIQPKPIEHAIPPAATPSLGHIPANARKRHEDAAQSLPPVPFTTLSPIIVSNSNSEPVSSPVPEATPVVPASPMPVRGREMPALFPKSPASKKSWGERIFTPENVRIVQSLGICIIFISAVALVRTQMWSAADSLTRFALLCLGTFLCISAGYVMRRFLSLRITGLGFLILGQLSVILDACSLLTIPGAQQGIYPYSPSSLWTICFCIFTAVALVNSSFFKEPLFNAFAYFGGLAAWSAGALWLGMNLWLMPSVFVPLIILSAVLSRVIQPAAWMLNTQSSIRNDSAALPLPAFPRWSLPWWLDAGFVHGGVALGFILPVSALYLGREFVAENYFIYAAAIAALATSIFVYEYYSTRAPSNFTAVTSFTAAILVLWPLPLAAHTFKWPWMIVPFTLAMPGSCLATLGLFIAALKPRALAARSKVLTDALLRAGVVAACTGFVLSIADSLYHPSTWDMYTQLSALVLSLLFAVIADSVTGAWVSVGCAAVVSWTALRAFQLPLESWPAIAISLALLGHAAWRFAKAEVCKNGRSAGDLLVIGSALALVCFSSQVSGSVCAGWTMLPVYALATAVFEMSAGDRKSRRTVGITLLTPCLYMWLWLYNVPSQNISQYLGVLTLLTTLFLIAVPRFVEFDSPLFCFACVLPCFLTCAALAGMQIGIHHFGNATISFAILFVTSLTVAIHFRRSDANSDDTRVIEAVSIFCLGFAGLDQAFVHVESHAQWPLALAALAALILVAGALCERLAAALTTHDDRAPFRDAAEAVALFVSIVAGVVLVNADLNRAPVITTSWIAAIVPMFIVVRRDYKKDSMDSINAMCSVAGGIALVFMILAGFNAFESGFWETGCAAAEIMACVWFFAVSLGLAVAAGVIYKTRFAPIAGTLACMGLAGCAAGEGILPPESFALLCVALAWVHFVLADKWAATPSAMSEALNVASVFAALISATWLIWHTPFANPGSKQLYALIAWAALGALASVAGGKRSSRTLRCCGALCASGFTLNALYGINAAPESFGPVLAALANLLLLLRWFSSDQAKDALRSTTRERAAGLIPAAILTGLLAAFFAVLPADKPFMFAITLTELAMLSAVLSVHTRRETTALPAERVFFLECVSWLLLAKSAIALSAVFNLPLSGPLYVLGGGLLLVIGMAAEALAGAIVGNHESLETSEPFVESRHLAAFLAGVAGLVSCFQLHISAETRSYTLLCMSVLTLYGSFARISRNQPWTRFWQTLSAFLSYVVFMPSGYLYFLFAHSTGSSWAGMYVMALAPILLIATYILSREKRLEQAYAAEAGTLLVCFGAGFLAIVANHGKLPDVPGGTFAAIALALLGLRLINGNASLTVGACAAVLTSAFFATRAMAHLPLWDESDLWAWQMPAMALSGLLLASIGGAMKLELIDTDSGDAQYSLVFICGALANLAALNFSLVLLFRHDSRSVYLDALIACMALASMNFLCARHWLSKLELVKHLSGPAAGMTSLATYFLLAYRDHATAWEWYTGPAALLMFVWAWRLASESENTEPVLQLTLGSVLAVFPSFIASIPHTEAALYHFAGLLCVALLLTGGAMLTRRKIPLMAGALALVAGGLTKTIQWAHYREVLWPLAGVIAGFLLLSVATLLESRMNHIFRNAIDRAKSEAQMFWFSWR